MTPLYNTAVLKFELFFKNSSGQITIMTAVLIAPLLLFIGGGLDWSQKIQAQTKMQSTMDSAILAVARKLSVDKDLSQQDMKDTAQIIFDANLSIGGGVDIDDFTIVNNDGLLKMTQTAEVSTNFLKLANIQSMGVSVASEVVVNFDGVDLALAVDLSGSMGGTKIRELRKATEILLDELTIADVSAMRVSFIPWTRGVNVGGYFDEMATNTPWPYPSSGNNHYPTTGSKKYYENRGYNLDNCIGLRSDGTLSATNTTTNHPREAYCPDAELIPLTDLKQTAQGDTKIGLDKLKAIAKTWQAKGGTGSHNGMYWAWATLSSAFYPVFGTETPEDPDSIKKYAVIMTDGLNNGWNSGQQFNNRMLAACTAMKNQGISIYAIVLEENSQTVRNTFEACASPSKDSRKYFIKTDNAADLSNDFKKIAEEIGQFYLSK